MKFQILARTTVLSVCFALTACLTAVQYNGVTSLGTGLTEAAQLDAQTQNSIAALTQALQKMSPNILPEEAAVLAREAHLYPMYLANVWEITSPPLLHNWRRNAGKREYGLCIDWTYAMRQRMRGLTLNSFDWHWGIANEGSEWREHSTLVVTPKGAAFGEGVILDPWRNSGKLFWARIGADERYDWKPYDEPEGWTPSRLESF
jgi:uncharacterized coiled-coil protein SlyX